MKLEVFAIKHVASGEYMPEVKGSRGYSHWEPGKMVMHKAHKGSIRLFFTAAGARSAVGQWVRGVVKNYSDYEGEDYLEIKDVGRKKEDLEIIPFTLTENAAQTHDQ